MVPGRPGILTPALPLVPAAVADPSLLLPPEAAGCVDRADASPLLRPPPLAPRLRSGEEMAPGSSSSSSSPPSNGLGLPAAAAAAALADRWLAATAVAATLRFLLAGRNRVTRPWDASDRTRMAAAHSSRSPREEATR